MAGFFCTDAAAVRHLVTANELMRSAKQFELSGLERYDRPLPAIKECDLLFGISRPYKETVVILESR